MRRTVSHFYLPIALLTLLWIAIPSCIYDYFPEEEQQGGLIVVSLNGVSTRAAGDPLFTDDGAINKVRIFVFVGGALEKNTLFTSGNDNFTNPFILEVATGTKDVYVVANESAALTPTLEAITSKAKLMAVMAESVTAPLAAPFLMTGKVTDSPVVLKTDPDRNTANVTLTRVVAKISLSFKKDTDATVSINKISLLSNAGKIPVWEGEPLVGEQSYWNWEKSYTTAVNLTGNAQLLETLYLYENLTDGSRINDTQLLIEATYNGVPTTYKVFVNENVTVAGSAGDPISSETNPADHLYSIKRNHHYQLTGTIKNMGEFDGLTLTTNVLPWQKFPSDWLFAWTWSIAPNPTTALHTYTVDGNGEVKFTFKLTNPIDALWIANLTNPTDFEFDGAYQGATDQVVTIVVKAKEAAGTEARTTEFYINVNYGGEWTEIPLISGGALIGEGNRVIIRQPANP